VNVSPRPPDRLRSPLAAVLVTIMIATMTAAVHAAPRDRRELQAREAFAAARYNDALDLYAKLYAEKLHPTYLRNVGRCYQNLGDPDHAISSFRDYLRQAKDVSPAERAEVEGYIGEMEALKRQREIVAAAPPTAPIAARPPPFPAAGAPPSTSPEPPVALATTATPSPPLPFYKRGLFWGAVAGVLVLGTVAVLAGTGAFSSNNNDPACPGGFSCQ
jgi:hypothetical protein